MITAAGGLVMRGDDPTAVRIVVVHRPAHEDWSLPKGKHDAGETSRACAIREVGEETGYLSRIVGEAGTTRYRVRSRPKEVDYYLMRPYRSVRWEPDDEVDEVRWATPEEAVRLLTYDFDRNLVQQAPLDQVVRHTTLHLIRHAAAGDRSRWEGPDPERPLTSKGMAQAKALSEELADIGITRILSSPFTRCVQTVEPLAQRIGSPVEPADELAEGSGPAQLTRLLENVSGTTVAMCSHGDVIPALLQRFQAQGARFLGPYECRKGSTWVIGEASGTYTEARYVPPPIV